MMTDNLLTLNAVLCDWLTVTSFDDTFFDYWSKKAQSRSIRSGSITENKKWQNYEGMEFRTLGGTMFVGKGVQKGRVHYAVYISGEEADALFPLVHSFVRSGVGRVTRLDLQATIRQPKKWSQFDLLSRMNEKGHQTGWSESRHRKVGTLATVYIGSRDSDRMTRVYQKVDSNGDKLLRFETEFKRDRAHAIVRAIESKRGRACDYWAYEVQSKKDRLTSLAFQPVVDGTVPMTERVRITTNQEKRRRWLLETCLPALRKYAWSHDGDPDVMRAFDEVMDEYYE